MARRSLRIIAPIAIAAACAGVFLWLRATQPEPEARPPTERVWTVSALAARPGDVQPELLVYGEIVAGRAADLRPAVGGTVAEVAPAYADGARVHQGDLLLAIDRFDYDSTLAERQAQLAEQEARVAEIAGSLVGQREQLDQDRAQLLLAEREVARRRDLADRGTTSQANLEAAEVTLSTRRQAVTQRETTIGQLEAQAAQARAALDRLRVAVARAERDLADTRLLAPFDGFLSATAVAVGQEVAPADRIARLVAADRLEARIRLTSAQFARIVGPDGSIDRPATVIWQTGADSFSYPARVVRSAAEVDATSGGVTVFARLEPNGLETALRPGAFVAVRVLDRAYRNVVRVPETAVFRTDIGQRIYVIDADSRLAAVPVRISGRAGDDLLLDVEIVPGTQIVTTRFPEIAHGLKVQTPAAEDLQTSRAEAGPAESGLNGGGE